jgi:hypothetical protein
MKYFVCAAYVIFVGSNWNYRSVSFFNISVDLLMNPPRGVITARNLSIEVTAYFNANKPASQISLIGD